ncbi:MFS transporter [uncultured Shewanella sp.]|uniref:MFS transporter n=1 Tax=uncultured Shewanella sp. TaxID=173975 RepID=UPI00261A823A|nr:MFS transporter [uncultured Shewanella sp.]
MNKNGFRALIWVNFSGATVDHLIKNTLVIFIGFQAQSEQLAAQFTTLGLALFMLPSVLLSGLAGQWGDNHQKLPLFKKLKTIEYVIIIVICYGLYINNLYLLCLLLLPVGIIACLTGPLKLAMIDERVEKQQRSQSSTLFQLSSIIAILIGSALAGGLLHVGLKMAITGILLCTFINAIGVYQQKNIAIKHKITHNKSPSPRSFYTQYQHMFKTIKQDPKLVLGCLLISFYWFFINLSYSQMTTLAKYQLNINEVNTSMLFVVMTVAIACGSLVFLILNTRLSQGKIIFVGSMSFALGYAALSMMIAFKENLPIISLLSEFQQVIIIISLSNLFSSQLLFLGYALLQVNGVDTQKTTIFAASNVISAAGMIASATLISLALHYNVNIKSLFLIYSLLSLGGGVMLWKLCISQEKKSLQQTVFPSLTD